MNTSLELTIEEFKKLDVKESCRNSGAILKENPSGQKIIVLSYLNQEFLIRLPDIEITSSVPEGSPKGIHSDIRTKDKVETSEKITLLHYLISSKGTPLSGKLIDFREVPEGNFYYSTFTSLVHKPFLRTFGEKPELFLKAGESLNGSKADLKDLSMKFLVLPRVAVTTVFYKGDEEFPPDCKFLFDSSIPDYLSTEAIVKVCEELVKELAVKIQ